MENKELKCKYCGSGDIKITFLGGSGKVIGIILICLGVLSFLAGLMTGNFRPAGLLWLVLGIASVIIPKYQCKGCNKRFS